MLLRFFKAENGQTLMEYGMITVIVSVALAGGLKLLQGSVDGLYAKILATVTSAI